MTTNYVLNASYLNDANAIVAKAIASVSKTSAEDIARRFFRKASIPMNKISKIQVSENEASWTYVWSSTSTPVSDEVANAGTENVASDFDGVLEPIMPTAAEVFAQMNGLLGDLYGRWQMEKEYEDWTDYHSVAEQRMQNLGVTMTSFTSRPFALKFKLAGKVETIGRNRSNGFELK